MTPWDDLEGRRKVARLCMMYKAINGLVALPTSHLHKSDSRTRGGLHNFKYIMTNKTQHANYSYLRTIKDWNKLPESLKATPNLTAFKQGFKSALYTLYTQYGVRSTLSLFCVSSLIMSYRGALKDACQHTPPHTNAYQHIPTHATQCNYISGIYMLSSAQILFHKANC